MFAKLMKSIVGTDWYILALAVLTLGLFAFCLHDLKITKKYVQNWSDSGTLDFSRYLHRELKICFSIFTAAISIFPLLGMFGTVKGLLMMDFVEENMENMKQNFFGALTSTAWGIIFSILFKLAHAYIQNDIETQIQKSEEMEQKAGNPKGHKGCRGQK